MLNEHLSLSAIIVNGSLGNIGLARLCPYRDGLTIYCDGTIDCKNCIIYKEWKENQEEEMNEH